MIKQSVKNIILLEDDIIRKTFRKEQDFYTEYYFYKEYKDFAFMPKLLKAENHTIYLEYIKGESLYNVQLEKQLLLGKTLAEFHKKSLDFLDQSSLLNQTKTDIIVTIHSDTSLHNYIFAFDTVYMLDFSDISIGNPLSDIYSVLLFFCELYPIDIFRDFMKRFFEIYFDTLKCPLAHSPEILQNEIKRFEERREKNSKCINNYHYFLKNTHFMQNYIK